MPSTQELLNSIINMQQNAQAALPVIPNNGNPMGANNMPAGKYGDKSPVPQQPGAPTGYEWLNPSPSIGMIDQMLAEPLIQPNVPTPVQPPVSTPVRPSPTTPVIPQRMARPNGVIMPNQNPMMRNVNLPVRKY